MSIQVPVTVVLTTPIGDHHRCWGWSRRRWRLGCCRSWRGGRLHHRHVICVLSVDIVGRHPASPIRGSSEVNLPPAAVSALARDLGALTGSQHAEYRVVYSWAAPDVQVGVGSRRWGLGLWSWRRGRGTLFSGCGSGFDRDKWRRCWLFWNPHDAEKRLSSRASLSYLSHNGRQALVFPAGS